MTTTERVTHWINGARWQGTSDRTGEVFDKPRARSPTWTSPESETVDEAVAAARSAFTTWGTSTPDPADAGLVQVPGIAGRRRGRVAELITAEHGKVLSDASAGR